MRSLLSKRLTLSYPPIPPNLFTTGTYDEHTTPDHKEPDMDFNVAAGVFMILMIALVTSLLLCCCKTYLVCKKRLRRRSGEGARHSTQTRLHNNLPVTHSCEDQPPSYADVTSTGEYVSTFSNLASDYKPDEDEIVVYWTLDTDAQENHPPGHDGQVIDETQNNVEVEPPDYDIVTGSTAAQQATSCRDQRRRRTGNNISQAFQAAVHTVSEFVSSRRRHRARNDVSETHVNRDSASELRDDSDVATRVEAPTQCNNMPDS